MTKKNWNDEDIPDQTGKIVIVTGANSGTGFAATRILSRKGAHVIMACRNEVKANKALESIKSENPDASLEFIKLDLGRRLKDFAVNSNAHKSALLYLREYIFILSLPAPD